MKIGTRIIKTAIAVSATIWVTQLMSLSYFAFAGILAALGVQTTRKKTVKIVAERFISCLIGMAFAYFLFGLFAFHPVVLLVLLIAQMVLLSRIHLQDGIITSIVVVMQVYSSQLISVSFLWNQLQLIVIGLGVALVVNLIYMPNLKKDMEEINEEIDELLSQIFTHYGNHITQPDYVWNGQEILTLEQKLKNGKELALRTAENQWLRQEEEFYRFIRMREKQFDWVKRMMILVSRVDRTFAQSYLLTPIFFALAKQVKSPYYSGNIREELNRIRRTTAEMDLPKTREEFETRSALFHLLRELEQFLIIAEAEKPVQQESGL